MKVGRRIVDEFAVQWDGTNIEEVKELCGERFDVELGQYDGELVVMNYLDEPIHVNRSNWLVNAGGQIHCYGDRGFRSVYEEVE